MTLFDIPVGFASIFLMILIGYFVLTVWFGSPEPVAQKISPPVKHAGDETPSPELNAG